ncbi:MAG: di-trans,poly-cis-decaprenylcistransferase [Deltaproteobacteria bacterium]|nr:di-trans,poly-cis-decaprenylcistransferase [Deltaproteobacteria bacterium]
MPQAPQTLELLEQEVRLHPVPAHVAIIMDGNGRWAEARGRSRVEGHREGSLSVRDVTRCARRVGIKALTLYAFSAQNWARPLTEVHALMDLLREYLESERAEILENGIRLHAVGDLDRLPGSVRGPLERLRADSAANTGMLLTLALSYGGQEELVDAARRLAEKVRAGKLEPSRLDAAAFHAELPTALLPQVDLLIRTSGEQRTSNFLPWQLAYAELLFVDTPWPEFRAQDLVRCLRGYQGRERRFGLTGAQVRSERVPPA